MGTVIFEETLQLQDDSQIVASPLAPGLDPNWSLRELQDHLGGIPLDRIRLYPSPGRATEQDLLVLLDQKTCIPELFDGVLVEKPMGHFESRLGGVIFLFIDLFIFPRKLGVVYTDACPIRLFPEQVRVPDVSFFSWCRFPNQQLPKSQVLGMAPDLAVEVISPSNTKAEMERKLAEYFRAGSRLVWYVYPDTETVRVFHSPTEHQDLTGNQVIDGRDVLPGFDVSVKTLFDRAMYRQS